MDIRMASNKAVPPRESTRVRASFISWMSLVKFLPGGRSRKASSLKFTMKTSSSRLESLTRASDGTPGVVLILPAGITIGTPDGELPGVAISSALAREFAWALLLHAEQLANGLRPEP